MNESNFPTLRRSGKRLVAAIAIAAALAVAITLAVVLLRPTTGAHPRAVTTKDPASSSRSDGASQATGQSDLGPAQPMSKKTADTALTTFLSSVAAIPASTSAATVTKRLSTVAAGDIVGAIQNQQQALKANGWRLKGTPTVTSVTIVSEDTTASKPTAVVRACVDSSKVTTIDSSGKAIPRSPSASTRAINIYTLEQRSGGWIVTAQTFPDNPDC